MDNELEKDNRKKENAGIRIIFDKIKIINHAILQMNETITKILHTIYGNGKKGIKTEVAETNVALDFILQELKEIKADIKEKKKEEISESHFKKKIKQSFAFSFISSFVAISGLIFAIFFK